MNTEALLRVAEMLELYEPAPPHEIADFKALDFDMKNWAWAEMPDPDENNYCGTSVCACGLAALDPWFRARGFVLTAYNASAILPDIIPMESAQELLEYSSGSRNRGVPWISFDLTYKGQRGMDAVKDFFELTELQAATLFGDLGRHMSPLIVAQNIRAVVAFFGALASPPAPELVDAP
jgi:hypothetical protein